MSGEQSPILQGPIKLRDGKKWKNRYARITRLSPVADFLTLQLWKDLKEVEKQKGPTKGSISLSEYLGVETGFNLDKESNTIALIFREVVIIIALENREILMKWQVRLTNQFEEGQQYSVHLVSAPKKVKLSPGAYKLHLQNQRFSLTSGIPVVLLHTWSMIDLRRYGAVDGGRFCFEGGTRCGKGEGLHVFRVDNPEDLQISFDLSSKGKLEAKKRSAGIGAHLSQSPSVASSLSTVNRSVESGGSGGSGTPLITSGFGSVRPREEIKRTRSRSRSKSINASAAWSSLDNGLAMNSPDTLSLAFSEQDQPTRMSSPDHLVDRRTIMDTVNISGYIPSDNSHSRDTGSRSCGSESEFHLNWNLERNNHPKRQGSVPWNGTNSSGTWNSSNRGAHSIHGTMDRVSMSSGDSLASSTYDQPKTILKVTTSPVPSKRGASGSSYEPSRTCTPDLHATSGSNGQRSIDLSSQRSGFRSPGSSLASPPLTPRSLRRTMGYQNAGSSPSCSCNSSQYPVHSREGTPGFQNYDVPRNLGIQETSGFYDTPRSIKMKPPQIGPMGNYDIPGEAIPVSSRPCQCSTSTNNTGQHKQVTVNALVHSSEENQQQYHENQQQQQSLNYQHQQFQEQQQRNQQHQNQHQQNQHQQNQHQQNQHQQNQHQQNQQHQNQQQQNQRQQPEHQNQQINQQQNKVQHFQDQQQRNQHQQHLQRNHQQLNNHQHQPLSYLQQHKLRHQSGHHSPQHSLLIQQQQQQQHSLEMLRNGKQYEHENQANYVNGHNSQNGFNGQNGYSGQNGQPVEGSRKAGVHGRSRSSCSSPNNTLDDMTWTCLSSDGVVSSEVSIPRVKLTGQGRMPVVDMSKINTARCFSEPPVSEKEPQSLVRSMSPNTGVNCQLSTPASSTPVYAQIDRTKKSCSGCVQKLPHRCTRQQQLPSANSYNAANYTNLEFAQSLSLYENSRDVLSRLAATQVSTGATTGSKDVSEGASKEASISNRPNSLLPARLKNSQMIPLTGEGSGEDDGQYLRMIPQLIRDYELMGFEDPLLLQPQDQEHNGLIPGSFQEQRVFSPDHVLSPDLITTFSPPSSICSSSLDLMLSPDRVSISSDRISICSSNYGEAGDTMAIMSDNRFDTIKMAPKNYGAKSDNYDVTMDQHNMANNLPAPMPPTATMLVSEKTSSFSVEQKRCDGVANEMSISCHVSSLCNGYVTIPRSRGTSSSNETANNTAKLQSPPVTMRRSASVPCKQDRNSTGSGGSSSSDSGVSTGSPRQSSGSTGSPRQSSGSTVSPRQSSDSTVSPRQSTLDQISSFSEAIMLASLNREPASGKPIQTTEI